MTRAILIAAVVTAALCVVEKASGEYELSLITTASSPNDFLLARLNNEGDIFFLDLCCPRSILTPTGVVFKDGDTIATKTVSMSSTYSYNDVADVVFRGVFSGGSGIFTQNDLLVESGSTIDGLTITGFDVQPSINSSGVAAFIGTIHNTGNGVFTQNEVVAAPFSAIDGKTITSIPNQHPLISETGRLTFVASFDDGGVGKFGIFSQDELLFTRGDAIDGTTISGWSWMDITESGVIGLQQTSIFVDDMRVVDDGDTIAGKTLDNIDHPTMNDFGQVAFRGAFSGPGGTAIFTPQEMVAGPGSIVAGGILNDAFQNPSINNTGDVLFTARYVDGTWALVLATRVVPEPSAGLLALIAIVGVVMFQRPKRSRNRTA